MRSEVRICKTFLDDPSSDKYDKKHKIQISAGEGWYTIKIGEFTYDYMDTPLSSDGSCSAYNMYKLAYKRMIEFYPDAILIKTHKNVKRSEMK